MRSTGPRACPQTNPLLQVADLLSHRLRELLRNWLGHVRLFLEMIESRQHRAARQLHVRLHRENDGEGQQIAAGNTALAGKKAVFQRNRGAKMRELLDGTSKTVVMAEYLTGTPKDFRGYPYTQRAGCHFLYVAQTPNSSAVDNLLAYDGFCGTSGELNFPLQNLPCVPGAEPSNSATARSRHAGGVYTTYADGSVQFVTDEIDLAVWQSLAWIADGK